MWWAGKRNVAAVYLGLDEIRLAHGDTQQVVSSGVPLRESVQSLKQALDSLPRNPKFRVLVSAGWCQPFLLPPVAGVAGRDEWRQIALGLVEEMTGMPTSCRLWLDQQDSHSPLAVALHPDLEAVLKTLCDESRLEALRPWWAEALEGLLKARPSTSATVRETPQERQGVAVIDGDAVTLLLAEGNRYTSAQSYALLDDSPQQVLARALISQGMQLKDVTVLRLSQLSSLPSPSPRDTTAFLELAA